MKPYAVTAAIFAAAAVACGSPKPAELVPIELQTVATIDQISDTTFFSDQWKMKYSDGCIYSLDAKRTQVLRFDDNLHFLNFIGANGRANNEITTATNLDAHNDTVAVYDKSGSMKFYASEGTHIGNKELDRHTPAGDFIMRDGYMYFPTTDIEQSAFARLSADGCTPFGIADQDDEAKTLSLKNNRFMHIHKGKIIAVAQFYPFIEIYDEKSLQLEKRIPYDDIPLVEQNILAAQQMPRMPNVVAITPVIRDCCFHGGRMYVLVPDRTDGKYSCNKVIAFDIGKTIRPVALYILGDSSYGTICADSGCIYAFDSKNTAICKIALP